MEVCSAWAFYAPRMTPPAADASRRMRLPAVVAVVQALLVLGPALAPGVVVAYDMPWSPDPRWTPFVLGSDTPAPRAVPSDAVAVLLGKVIGAGMAQSLVLLATLVGLGLGAALLLAELRPGVGGGGLAAATVAAVWNPFVHERLAAGQWVVLVGAATLPWAIHGALRAVDGRAGWVAVALPLVIASAGGVNALLLVALSVLAVTLAGLVRHRDRRSASLLLATAVVSAGGAAVWAVPALTSAPVADPAGIEAFAPRPDTVLGVAGSLVSGGGFWNEATHPSARGSVVVALLAAVACLVAAVAAFRWTRRRDLVLAAVGLPTVIVLLSALPATRHLWTLVVTEMPGGGALRDSQKLLAAWVLLVAAGAGMLADRAMRAAHALRVPVLVLALGLPLALSPQLAWGLTGRLESVAVPHGYRDAVSVSNTLPPGDLGLLPWGQYRRYAWNGDRVSLTLAPRMMERIVLFDDGLPLRSGPVAGESPRAQQVSRDIAAGTDPVTALEHAGVRYVAAERGGGGQLDLSRVRAAGEVVVDDPWLVVVDLGPRAAGPSAGRGPAIAGAALTGLTVCAVIGAALIRRTRRF